MDDKPTRPRFLRPADAALYSAVSVSTLRRWVARGWLTAYPVSATRATTRRYRLCVDELDAVMNQLAQGIEPGQDAA